MEEATCSGGKPRNPSPRRQCPSSSRWWYTSLPVSSWSDLCPPSEGCARTHSNQMSKPLQLTPVDMKEHQLCSELPPDGKFLTIPQRLAALRRKLISGISCFCHDPYLIMKIWIMDPLYLQASHDRTDQHAHFCNSVDSFYKSRHSCTF